MTVTQILLDVSEFRPMTRDTLYKHMRRLRIKPLGKVRQCPQHFPDDTAQRVLVLLGFKQPQRRTNGRSRRRQLQREAA
jgi:hypothetical protein